MNSIGVRQLRQRASEVLRRVAAGETVEVTQRGRPVARIVPVGEKSALEQMVLEGRATQAVGDLLDIEPVSLTSGPSLSEVLAEMRANER